MTLCRKGLYIEDRNGILLCLKTPFSIKRITILYMILKYLIFYGLESFAELQL